MQYINEQLTNLHDDIQEGNAVMTWPPPDNIDLRQAVATTEKDKYEIQSTDLLVDKERVLGKGNFGIVYLAKIRATGAEVVVKIPIRKPGLSDEYLRSLYEEELSIALKLKMSTYSNEAVTVTSFCSKLMWIVMKRYEQSLEDFLFKRRDQRFATFSV